MKITGEKTFYVCFTFGSLAYVGVTLYEGKTVEECLRMRSEKIEEAYIEGKWVKIR